MREAVVCMATSSELNILTPMAAHAPVFGDLGAFANDAPIVSEAPLHSSLPKRRRIVGKQPDDLATFGATGGAPRNTQVSATTGQTEGLHDASTTIGSIMQCLQRIQRAVATVP